MQALTSPSLEQAKTLITQGEAVLAQAVWPALEETSYLTTARVLEAMRLNRLGEEHFACVTGYGHNDLGREALDNIFAHALQAEAALVRPHIVSGTHALAVALRACLHPGDTMLCLTGAPYDTLEEVIGLRGNDSQSLKAYGINYRQTSCFENVPEGQKIRLSWSEEETGWLKEAKLLYLQRSRGYSLRPALMITDLEALIAAAKAVNPGLIVLVDNCYGEFMEPNEPTAIGADLIAGSLIKNPGGGLALTGGYVAGRANLVEQAASVLTCPGVGSHGGYMAEMTRTLLQGLFLAPSVVKEALKGMTLAAWLMENQGYMVSPRFDEPRSDIIQALQLGSAQTITEFCRIVQAYSPVSSYVTPIPAEVPGYESPIIMAGGTFVDGSSIELSADAPLREPYTLFLQGGLTYAHTRLVLTQLIASLQKEA